ncbi:hypothetical protein CYMTET_5061 [Cymbomonas tetramitiformis]|uniref:Reverse transcriptase Ty1/copia-type domain-containing protein n=1 Tax=Cymbomonas tetramitiformis TaxID=36881 RepID=A0AAE0H066_9CHLO|nr:hypothetical protein CYMTET_5061 [Cymbomonas tetramitiformis]
MGLGEHFHMVLHTDVDSTMIADQTAKDFKQHGIEQRHGSSYLHGRQAQEEQAHRDVQAMTRALLRTSVLKVQAEEEACWISLGAYLDGKLGRLAALRSCPTLSALNAQYPPFTKVTVDAGLMEPEAATICARAVHAHTHPYCLALLTNFTYLDLPAGKVHFLVEHSWLYAQSEQAAVDDVCMLPDGVSEPKTYRQVLCAPDAAQWLEAMQAELEALVQVKKALLMVKEEDVPPRFKPLDMFLVLKVKLDKHRQLPKRKARFCAKGNKQDYHDTFAPCTQLSTVRVMIALALNLGLVVYHMDVETPFLNSCMDEDLYV